MDVVYGRFGLGRDGRSEGVAGDGEPVLQIAPSFWRSFMTELDELDRQRRADEALTRRQAFRLVTNHQDQPLSTP